MYVCVYIGQRIAAPSFAALACRRESLDTQSPVPALLNRLAFFQSFSSDGVSALAEEVMFIRHLSCDKRWGPVVHKCVQNGILETLNSIDTLTTWNSINNNSNKSDEKEEKKSKSAAHTQPHNKPNADEKLGLSSSVWDNVWISLGSLAVYGGFIDYLRAGTRVYLRSSNTKATVVSRDYSKNIVNVVRDGEGSVTEEKTHDAICIGSRPFRCADFAPGVSVPRVLTVLERVTSTIVKNRVFNERDSVFGKRTVDENKKLAEGTKVHVSVATIALNSLYTFSMRALHSVLLHHTTSTRLFPTAAAGGAVVPKSLFFSVMATACQPSPFKRNSLYSTAYLEDKYISLHNELLRRCRVPSAVRVIVTPAQPRLTIRAPSAMFEADYVNIGGETKTSIHGNLSYVRLDEEPSKKLCYKKIVMIDTYGEFEKRILKMVPFEPLAIVLCLHSETAKMENLNVDSGTDGKESKSTGNVLRQAQESVMNAQAALNAAPIANMGFGRRVRMTTAAPITTAMTPKKEKKDAKTKRKFNPLLKKMTMVCINSAISKIIREVLGVAEYDEPDEINKRMLSIKLVAKGYPRKHTYRALEKAGFDVEKAAKWLDANSEWLYDQTTTTITDVKDADADKKSAEEEENVCVCV